MSGDVFWSSCSRRSSNKYTRFPSCYCILSHFSNSFWWDTKKELPNNWIHARSISFIDWKLPYHALNSFKRLVFVCKHLVSTMEQLHLWKETNKKCNDLAIVHFSLLFVPLSKVTGPNTFHLANNLWNDNFLYFLFMLNHDFTIICVLFVTWMYKHNKVLFRLCCVCVVLPFLSLTSTKHHEWSKRTYRILYSVRVIYVFTKSY